MDSLFLGSTAHSNQPPSNATVSASTTSSSSVTLTNPATRQFSAPNPASPTIASMPSTASRRTAAWQSSGTNQRQRTASPSHGGATAPSSNTTPTPPAAQ